MPNKTLLCLILLLISFSTALAEKTPDHVSLARQHEKNGNFGTAVREWVNAENTTSSLAKRAEYRAEAARVCFKSGSFEAGIEQLYAVRHNDPKRVNSLIAKLEPSARASLVTWVSANRSMSYPWTTMRPDRIGNFYSFFPQGRELLAEDFFKLAVAENDYYWYDLAAEASDKVAGKIVAKFMGDMSKVSLQEKAKRIKACGKYITDFKVREQYTKELLPEGKRLAKIPGEEAKTTEIRDALIVLMGREWMQENLPETKIFSFGEFEESGKAGEQTPYWITSNTEGQIRFLADNHKFKMIFENGKEVRIWIDDDKQKLNSESGNHMRFKLYFVENCGVTLVVKK